MITAFKAPEIEWLLHSSHPPSFCYPSFHSCPRLFLSRFISKLGHYWESGETHSLAHGGGLAVSTVWLSHTFWGARETCPLVGGQTYAYTESAQVCDKCCVSRLGKEDYLCIAWETVVWATAGRNERGLMPCRWGSIFQAEGEWGGHHMQKSWRWKHTRCEQQDGKIFCVVKAQEPELISGSDPGKKSGAKAWGTSYAILGRLDFFLLILWPWDIWSFKKFEVADCDIFKK